MATSPTVSKMETLAFRDAFNASLCKLKALELLLRTPQLAESLDTAAADGIMLLFGDVIGEFEALAQAV